MRFTVGLLLLTISINSFSQFLERTITKNSAPLTDVYMITANVGYVGGVDGIFKTSDAGLTWTRLPYFTSYQSPDSIYYNAMNDQHLYFSDENNGYAVGWGATGNHEQIIKTTDGGFTWQMQHLYNPDPAPFQPLSLRLRDIYFTNSTTAITVGYRGRILKTTNGGATWTAKNSTTDKNLEAVEFFNTSNGFAAGAGILLFTNDGGETWTQKSIGYSITDVHFTDALNGIATTNQGNILRTADGGLNWTVNSFKHSSALNRISFVDSQLGFLAGNGILLKTEDGGNHFEKSTFNHNVIGLQALSANQFYLTTDKGKYLASVNGNIQFAPIALFDQTSQSPCKNTLITISNLGKPTNTHTWFVDDVQVSSSYDLSYAFPTGGNHIVKLVSRNGAATDAISKTYIIKDVPPIPNISIKVSIDSICAGRSTQIIVENAQAGVQYNLWNGSAVIGTVDGLSWKTFSFTTTTDLSIQSTVSNECGATVSTHAARVFVAPLVSNTTAVALDRTSICSGDSTFIQVNNSQIGITYSMYRKQHPFDQIGKSQQGNGGILKFYTPPLMTLGVYELRGNNILACGKIWGTFGVTIRAFTVDFQAESIFPITGNELVLKNNSTADSYIWEFDAGATPLTSTDLNPRPIYSSGGKKSVKLKGIVTEGCAKTVEHTYTVITPADNGVITRFGKIDNLLDTNHRVTDFRKINDNYYLLGYIFDGNFTASSSFRSNHKFFIAKFNAAGQIVWMHKSSEVENSTPNDIGSAGSNFLIDDQENIYATGYFRGNTFTLNGKTFTSTRVNKPDERKGILLKLDKDGKIKWGDIFEIDPNHSNTNQVTLWTTTAVTDLVLHKNSLYINLYGDGPQPILNKGNQVYHITGITDFLGGFFRLDTAGFFQEFLNFQDFQDLGSSRYIRTAYGVEQLDILQNPALSIDGDNIWVMESHSIQSLALRSLHAYDINLRTWNTSPSNGPTLKGSSPGLYNWKTTNNDPVYEQKYFVVSANDISGIIIKAKIGDDSLRIQRGGFLLSYNNNKLLRWYNYLPYGELVDVKTIDSDIYVLGNYNKWMGSYSAPEGNYKGIKSNGPGIFLAKYDHKGNLQWINDVGDGGENYAFSMDYNECTDDLIILAKNSTSHYIINVSLDTNTSAACFEAAFKASSRTVNIGTPVSFEDLSMGNPSQWQWTFDGAQTLNSTSHSPTGIIYTMPGNYGVTLTISANGNTDTKIIENYITVVPKITNDFKSSTTEIVAGGFVDFSDLTVGEPEFWEWSFEGGEPATSTTKNPAHVTYHSAGNYGVTLTAGRGSMSDTKTVNAFIKVHPLLKADFEPKTTVNILVGQAISFSSLSIGNPDTYEWVFEGGNPSTSNLQNPLDIRYSSTPGNYKVSLKVTGNIQSDIKIQEGIITVHDLEANFRATRTEVVEGESVDFEDLSIGDPVAWEWNFEGATPASSFIKHPSGIVYKTPGRFDATLNAKKNNLQDTKLQHELITVFPLLTTDFVVDKTEITIGDAVNFTDRSAGLQEGIYQWLFEGGTPSTSSAQDPNGITYSEAGIYPVRLIVSANIQTKEITKAGLIKVNVVTGIENENPEFSVYPNPTSGKIHINGLENYSLTLFTVFGESVMELPGAITGDQQIDIPLKSGAYILKIQTSDKVYYKKLLVER